MRRAPTTRASNKSSRPWRLGLTLHRWQKDALQSWAAAGHVGIAKVITGAGKTVLALQAVEALKKETSSLSVVVIVPTKALMDQWESNFKSFLHIDDESIATVSSDGCGPPGRPVTIFVVNSARRLLPKYLKSPQKTLLIADECHHYASNDSRRILDITCAYRLGLSATPERWGDTGFEDILVPKLGPVIYEYTYSAALIDGILPRFELHNYRIPLTAPEKEGLDILSQRIRKASLALSRRYGVPIRELVRVVPQSNDPSINGLRLLWQRRRSLLYSAAYRVPATVRIVLEHAEAKTIVFHEQIAAARAIAAGLAKQNVTTAEYHTGISESMRRVGLQRFRAGLASTLVTCRALDEGIDVPDASVGILAASTASTRQRIQRMGRVLRRHPGKGTALIVTLYASDLEAESLAEEAVTLEGIASVKWFEVRKPGEQI